MKTQRRHELQTNVLAHSLARWIERAKPYSKAGTAVLIAVVVALFAWAYLSTQSTRREADGWNEYFDATGGRNPDPRELLRDISRPISSSTTAPTACFWIECWPATSCARRAKNFRHCCSKLLTRRSYNAPRTGWPGRTKRWATWNAREKNTVC